MIDFPYNNKYPDEKYFNNLQEMDYVANKDFPNYKFHGLTAQSVKLIDIPLVANITKGKEALFINKVKEHIKNNYDSSYNGAIVYTKNKVYLVAISGYIQNTSNRESEITQRFADTWITLKSFYIKFYYDQSYNEYKIDIDIDLRKAVENNIYSGAYYACTKYEQSHWVGYRFNKVTY